MDASPDPYAGVIAGRGDAFYADADALRRAVITRGCANPIHLPSMVKVDLFVAGGTSLDEQQIARRLRVDPGGGRELQGPRRDLDYLHRCARARRRRAVESSDQ